MGLPIFARSFYAVRNKKGHGRKATPPNVKVDFYWFESRQEYHIAVFSSARRVSMWQSPQPL
jgi:hypothetical protein